MHTVTYRAHIKRHDMTYQILGTGGYPLRGREGYVYRSAAWVRRYGHWLESMGYRAVQVTP